MKTAKYHTTPDFAQYDPRHLFRRGEIKLQMINLMFLPRIFVDDYIDSMVK